MKMPAPSRSTYWMTSATQPTRMGTPCQLPPCRPTQGAGSVSTDGSSVTYTPAANYSSPATITFTASDGTSSFSAFFTISFNASNDAPVAVDDTETLTEDASLTSITVLDDDTDADGDHLQSAQSATPGPEPQPLTQTTPGLITHRPPTSTALTPSPTPCPTAPPQTPEH